MIPDRPELRRGRIVWSTVCDHHGVAKNRPVVILTPTAHIHASEPVVVMAITTTFREPPPHDHVPLPWHPASRTSTRLRRRSAAVLSRIIEVDAEELGDVVGDVPAALMTYILKLLNE